MSGRFVEMKRMRLAPQLTNDLKESLVHRVEPYLKAGMTIKEACLLSGVPRSTLYKIMDEDHCLRDRIDIFRMYLNIVTVTSISRQLHRIVLKQQAGSELTNTDLDFLKWFAVNSKHCREEFGRQAINNPAFHPEVEIRKITRLIDESCESNKHYATS